MILTEDWLDYEHEHKGQVLADVLTTKEVERLYDLPPNTVLQDIRRGRIRSTQYRQSGRIWLITRRESNKVYSNYDTQRRRG